jgi:uncharacterized Ntn-hydrolase superfamily protein
MEARIIAGVTYSIVARDAETGELGAAVQSRSFGTGRTTVWVRPDVGAVATQSFGDPSYGALGLELMAAGRGPEAALAGRVRADEHGAYRQVAFLDASGAVAAHTGDACIPAAGHLLGDGFSVQGNLLASDRVWPAMAEAFAAAQGTLAERLLDALDAAQAAGGDWRGQQAGAVLVVAPGAKPWERVANVRVDDHPEPLVELRRLVLLEQAYRRMATGGEPPARDRDVLSQLDQAWAALSAAGTREEAKQRLERLLEFDERYIELVRRRRRLAELLGIEPFPGAF